MHSNRPGFMVAALFAIAFNVVGWTAVPGQQDAATASYAVDPTWPQRPEHLAWGQMPGLALDGHGQVYISTRSSPAVQVYRTDGTFVRAWDIKDATGAHFIRVDPEGNIWTTDIKSHLVCKHSPEGRVLLTLGTAGEPGTDQTHFDRPTDVAVLPAGDIFVSDGYGNRRIVHFDRTGKFIKQWGQAGTAPGQFALPHAIVADSQGRLYVADRENARIQVFDTSGKLLAIWSNLVTPWGLCMTKNDELWVCGSSAVRAAGHPTGAADARVEAVRSSEPGRDAREAASEWLVLPPADQVVLKLNLQGHMLLRVPLVKTPTPPGRSGQVDWVHGIAVDAQGNLYLGDIQGQRAQKFLRQP